MKTQTFEPGSQYLNKLRLVTTIVALLVLVGGFLLGWLLSLDKDMEAGVPRMVIIVTAIIDAVWWVPAMLLTAPYYRSLSYEIQDDEVIVRVGIWTKSVKHVPYRTVTNLVVKRDILDRWFFNTGTLNIQTAGMSGTTGAEESLVGLTNVQQVYEIVVRELRRFRGGMAPNAAGLEVEPALSSTDALNDILTEVQAIRETLEKE